MSAGEKIQCAIQKCKDEQNGLNRYLSIEVVISILEKMLNTVNVNNLTIEEKDNIAGGSYKIVSDDFNLLKSDIGKAIMDAKSEYLK